MTREPPNLLLRRVSSYRMYICTRHMRASVLYALKAPTRAWNYESVWQARIRALQISGWFSAATSRNKSQSSVINESGGRLRGTEELFSGCLLSAVVMITEEDSKRDAPQREPAHISHFTSPRRHYIDQKRGSPSRARSSA
jgi:hypothetical protein